MSRHQIFSFFFFNDTATTEIYTLSLHDALPILSAAQPALFVPPPARQNRRIPDTSRDRLCLSNPPWSVADWHRSEEHTSELQSRLHLVCRLLLEKKKIHPYIQSYFPAQCLHYID